MKTMTCVSFFVCGCSKMERDNLVGTASFLKVHHDAQPKKLGIRLDVVQEFARPLHAQESMLLEVMTGCQHWMWVPPHRGTRAILQPLLQKLKAPWFLHVHLFRGALVSMWIL